MAFLINLDKSLHQISNDFFHHGRERGTFAANSTTVGSLSSAHNSSRENHWNVASRRQSSPICKFGRHSKYVSYTAGNLVKGLTRGKKLVSSCQDCHQICRMICSSMTITWFCCCDDYRTIIEGSLFWLWDHPAKDNLLHPSSLVDVQNTYLAQHDCQLRKCAKK